MTKRNILVTGADGFIGSHLVESLVRKGHSVRALCQYNSFGSIGWLDDVDPQVLKSVEICLGDIRDGNHMKNIVTGTDTVMHLAALIAIPFSYQSPRSYIDTNVLGTQIFFKPLWITTLKNLYTPQPVKYMDPRNMCLLMRNIL